MNEKRNIADIYPLSPIQQGMLFHTLYNPGSTMYFQQFHHQIHGEVDVEAFRQAWQCVVDRHTILRSAFVWEEVEQHVQVVRQHVTLPWQAFDWRHLSLKEQDFHLNSFLEADRERGFQLNKAPLMRLTLIHLGDETYHFVWSHHHLLLDGWSLPIVLQEVFTCYQALCQQHVASLPPPIPYRTYIAWLQQQNHTRAEQFWRQRLQGFTSPTPLGMNGKPPTTLDWEAEHLTFSTHLTEQTTVALHAFAKQHRLTLSTLIQGAWAILLHRYSGQKDVLFGVTVSGRHPDLVGVESIVGVFINTLPIRVQFSEKATTTSWLQTLQMQTREQEAYAFCALSDIQAWSDVAQGTSLFESIVVFENYPMRTWTIPGTRLQITDIQGFERTNYPLALTVEPGATLHLQLDYDKRRFGKEAVTRLLAHLQVILKSIAEEQHTHIKHLPLLTAVEEHQMLQVWSGRTQPAFPASHQCVHQLLEAQAAQHPHKPALVWHESYLTYAQLNARVNQLARYLRKMGVGPETLVALYVDRSFEMMIGLLGILKAGGAYVPLDVTHPHERTKYILQDADAQVLVTKRAFLPPFSDYTGRIVTLDAEWHDIARESDQNPLSLTQPEHLAYLIYTSGSTGRPKGVLIQHNTLTYYIQCISHVYGLQPAERILQFATICFDAATEDIFMCLLNGATLVLRTESIIDSIPQFVDDCQRQGISVLNIPTAYWHEMVSQMEAQALTLPPQLRLVVIGGERALPGRLDAWQEMMGDSVQLISCYGQTEATIVTTFVDLTHHQVQPDAELPIGRPISGASIYVLDHELRPVPAGVPGELFVGGCGLGRGYWQRATTTAERFMPDPWGKGERLYRTGDLVCYGEDGSLTFLGRVDHQVKIRGFRVELGEIETVLRQHGQVREAVVIAHQAQPGHIRLIGYIVAHQSAPPVVSELLNFLKNKLPDYMVPVTIIVVDAFKLTATGKIDRLALPIPDSIHRELTSEVAGAITPVEEVLVAAWRDVLKVDQVGIYDNFFELGGDSILSIQVAARAGQQGVHITPRQIFQHQMIASLAQVATESPRVRAQQSAVTGFVPMTPIQEWFFSQALPQPNHFNQSLMLEIAADVDVAHVHKALSKILLHHDALRARFYREEDTWHQHYVAPDGLVPLTKLDLSALSDEARAAALAKEVAACQASLDIVAGPLMKVVFFTTGTQTNYMLWVIHHLVVDGVSWRILLEDFVSATQQLTQNQRMQLSPKTTSYRKWAKQLLVYSESEQLMAELDYWLHLPYEDTRPLALDYPENRSNNTQADAAHVRLTLPPEATHALLQEVPAVYNTQINDVLLTALAQTFNLWTGRETVYLELEGHGREQLFEDSDVSRTVSWFTTTYPVILILPTQTSPGPALKGIKEQLRRIPNRGIGYGLLRYLTPDQTIKATLASTPYPEISFNYLGQVDQSLSAHPILGINQEFGHTDISPYQPRTHILEINSFVMAGKLQIDWTFNHKLHQKSTIEQLAASFINHLQQLITHCQEANEFGYTPSDFPEALLTQTELDELVEEVVGL